MTDEATHTEIGTINTAYLQRCIDTLQLSLDSLDGVDEDSVMYEMYRNSLVKSFEITLEQSGKLLRKALLPYFASKRTVARVVFRDLFRYANKHGLIDDDAVVRWLIYRDNRNDTAHDYGIAFAQQTVGLAQSLIDDATQLKAAIDVL